ncbi:MAG: flagellar hook protein FlgE [Deltaproteobacteria bacterium]|nr:flagellar hook protein FlgE [Deltaproteobacteria bacterium]
MISSLFAGVSGLRANANAMAVIGDNIANVNTTSFKTNRASFANILSQSLSGSSSNDIGRGVQFWGTSSLWTQGSVENTSSPTDLAINGRGFFMVKDQIGNAFYTRAGSFKFDKEGNLVNPDGLKVQGYAITSNGTLGSVADICIPTGSVPPSPTDKMSLTVNLNADADPLIPDAYSTTVTVYDSLGSPVPVTMDFTCTAANVWEWSASVAASDGTVAPPAAPYHIAFDSNGMLDPANCDPPGANPFIDITLLNGADPLHIEWAYLNSLGNSDGTITGYASPSTTTFLSQNGFPPGILQSTSVDEQGYVTGVFSNGQLKPLYQIVLADFPSYQGLSALGKNLYAESRSSGEAMLGTAGNGRLGGISPNGLEMSNVDLASEFVKMITTQRAFQANSRVITTSDEILADLISIKR